MGACKSLLVFHCNCGSILYRFRDKVRHWSKIAFFQYPCIRRPAIKSPRRNIAKTFDTEKQGWCEGMSSRSTQYRRVTDRPRYA